MGAVFLCGLIHEGGGRQPLASGVFDINQYPQPRLGILVGSAEISREPRSMSPDAPELGWQNACQRHRLVFLATVEAHGIHDVRVAERIRRRLVREICNTFPIWGLNTWVRRECVSCVI